jgi:toxin ParE1/3/4
MARVVWTEPALDDLHAIADYISLDKPDAAKRYVTNAFHAVEGLELFPASGKRVGELPRSPYRELVVPPCRIFYREEKSSVFIPHVLRGERLLREFLLKERDLDG